MKVGPAAGFSGAAMAQPGPNSTMPDRLRVEVVGQAQAKRAGYPVILQVSPTDLLSGSGLINLEVSYSGFRDAFGADWDSRLTLVSIPACALTTPEFGSCVKATQLVTTNNRRAGTLAADIDLSAGGLGRRISEKQAALEGVSADGATQPMTIAVMAAGSSDVGDYTKTDFHPDFTWAAGGNSGDFSLSYPLVVPPVAGTLVPQVGLTYSSGNVDGQTVGVNVQPFWGEGWNYTPGYVERSYRACNDDTANAPKYTITTSDSCWRLPNARMVLNGKAVELVLGSDGKWRSDNDDAAKVELLTNDTETYNWGDEHWKVSTPDGTVYHFGLSRLPGWTAGDRETRSVLGMPVFSNHNGEPCVDAQGVGWTTSWCAMAYRWNLDYVVDRNGNTMSYWYTKETNTTALAGNANQVTGYDRFGLLDRIEYGTRAGTGASRESAPGARPPAQVVFTKVDRCLSGSCPTHDRANYPDTAWDLNCAAAPCSNNMTPSFWSARRVSQISTEVYSGTGDIYNRVDEWALGADFPADASGNPLRLTSIARTGKVAGSTTLPSMLFSGTRYRNRADWDPNGTMADPMKYRITSVRTETGGQIDVTYGPQDAGCQFGSPFPDPDNNDKRCFPRYWTNPTGTPGWAWWHKYIVSKVVEKDLVGGTPDKETSYSYSLDGASSSSGPVVLWAFDKNALAFSTSTSYKSWADWRGYSTVTTTVGVDAGQQVQTKALFLRGLHGDRTDNGYTARTASVTNSLGETTVDEAHYTGMTYETQTLDAPAGQAITKTITDYTRFLTGTRDMTNSWSIPPMQWSYITRTARERTMTWLPLTSSWRTTDRATTWNPTYGVIEKIDDLADAAPTAPGDDMCVRQYYTYPAAGAAYLIAYPNRVEKVGVKCATAPSYPGDVISDVRSFYDGAGTYSTAPVKGNITRTEKVASYTGTTPNPVMTSISVYDAWGRPTSVKDANNLQTTTTYTHTAGLLSSLKVTNPALHDTILTYQTARGLPVSTTDANLKVSTGEYDPLGRLIKIWEPGRSAPALPDVEYQYQLLQGAPSFVRTRRLGPNGNQIDAYEIYDGRLNVRQVQTTAPDSKRVIQDSQYDKRGFEVKKSVFYNSASGPTSTLYNVDAAADLLIDKQNRYVYDQAGRRTADELWKRNVFQFRTSTVYQGDRTTVIPPTGAFPSMDVADARGRLTEKRMFLTSNLNGAFDTTSYAYNKAGLLASVKDPLNNQWTYEYDVFGRRTKVIDPDAGTSEWTYDNVGRVLTSKDGNNVVLAYAYNDQLGRTTAIHEGSLAGPKRAEWVYDTVDKGQLTSSTRHDGGLAYTMTVGSYDDGYRPESVTQTIPGFGSGGTTLNYTVTNTYKVDGSVATQALPAAGELPAETITHAYSNAGFATTLTSGIATYVSETSYAFDGRMTQQLLGAPGSRVKVTNVYVASTRQLTHHSVGTETATVGTYITKYSTDYGYDQAGNITSAAGKTHDGTSLVADQEECLRYDYLRRLKEAWTQTSGACTTPQRTGADPYWRQWTFDKIGNWLTQKDLDTTNTDWTYQVGAAFGVKPHQVKNVNATGPKAGTPTRTFSYDNAGNTTIRTSETGASQTLTWDKEGHLGAVTGGFSYVYDVDGNRLIARESAKSTLYLADGTELALPSGGSPTATRYYAGVAVRDAAGLRFICSDHHGSGTIQVDAITLTPQRRRMMPYGEPRGTPPAGWVGTKGFVNGTNDGTGLTHIGAREYEPTLGRFVSTDPVMDLTDPQQWHAYTYANSNPATWSDPDGRVLCGDNGCNQTATPNSGGGWTVKGTPVNDVPPCAPRCQPYKPPLTPTVLPLPGSAGGQTGTPLGEPSPTPWGDNAAAMQEYMARALAMCSQSLIVELCIAAANRDVAELASWLPYVGWAGSAYLIDDAINNEDYFGAGIEVLGLIPIGGKLVGKAFKLPTGIKLNKIVGDAYRDKIADGLRQIYKANGKDWVVKTDATHPRELTFEIPGKTPRKLDIKVEDGNGNVIGYIEVKSGLGKADPDQLAKDAYLRSQGMIIDYVYDDMFNLTY